MMNIRQRSVNVNRVELLAKLRQNLELHRAEYAQALSEFQERLLGDLRLAAKKVAKIDDPMKLQNFRFSVPFPQNHENDYVEVIEMLEMSVDENINLDSDSFKAYIKNEWHWKGQFDLSKTAYLTVGSSLSL